MTCSICGSSAPIPAKPVTRYAAEAAARRGIGLELHRQILLMSVRANSPLFRQTQRAAETLLQQLAPRDELETMQVHQLLWTHALLGGLAAQAQYQTGPMFKIYLRALRDLSDSFRRQLADFQPQRKPARRSRGGFVAIRNANIAANFPVTPSLPPRSQMPQLPGQLAAAVLPPAPVGEDN